MDVGHNVLPFCGFRRGNAPSEIVERANRLVLRVGGSRDRHVMRSRGGGGGHGALGAQLFCIRQNGGPIVEIIQNFSEGV